MAQFSINITEDYTDIFLNDRDEAFPGLLEEIFNQVFIELIRAEPYERTKERTAYRNGYRGKEQTFRVGTLTL